MRTSPHSWGKRNKNSNPDSNLMRSLVLGAFRTAPGHYPLLPTDSTASTWSAQLCPSSLGSAKTFGSVQSLSHVRPFVTPRTAARQASLSITNSQSLLKFMSIKPVMPSSHLILCCPLLLLPSIFPSIRIFSTKSVLRIRWPKYWRFRITPSNEYSGLISFRIDWLDLLVVQGTLKSLLQHHGSKASILRCSAFFIVQLSHPYMMGVKNHMVLKNHDLD